MHQLVAAVVFHGLRILVASVVAAVIWVTLSLPLGLVLTPLLRGNTAAIGSMVTITAALTFVGAGCFSARFVTPGSYLHAAAAAFTTVMLWALIGGAKPWYGGLYFAFAAAGLGVVGAWIARRYLLPPNNTLVRTHDE